MYDGRGILRQGPQDARGLMVGCLPEPLTAGLVYLVPSSQLQREKADIQVVGILNYSLSLILAAPGVRIL